MSRWILTSEQLPPKYQWVLIIREDDYQKPWEIMCYMGIKTNQRFNNRERVWEEYQFPAWTSGHGDVMSWNPTAWMPLPDPYGMKPCGTTYGGCTYWRK